ncbi:MAG: type II toxin-antitoxin system VapC family toxin [Pseudolabrys sp.]
MDQAPPNAMSTGTYVELINVIDRKAGGYLLGNADELLATAMVELIPFTLEQAQWARHARLTYGIGHHPARLNFGDCFSYALAKVTGEPLLFKGDDFSRTDVEAAG